MYFSSVGWGGGFPLAVSCGWNWLEKLQGLSKVAPEYQLQSFTQHSCLLWGWTEKKERQVFVSCKNTFEACDRLFSYQVTSLVDLLHLNLNLNLLNHSGDPQFVEASFQKCLNAQWHHFLCFGELDPGPLKQTICFTVISSHTNLKQTQNVAMRIFSTGLCRFFFWFTTNVTSFNDDFWSCAAPTKQNNISQRPHSWCYQVGDL